MTIKVNTTYFMMWYNTKEVIFTMAIQIVPIDTGRSSTKLLNSKSFKSVFGDSHPREISDNEGI